MVFKLIITDQINKTAGFTFDCPSISETIDNLERFFGENVRPEMAEGHHRAVLYNIQFENDGEDFEALKDNLSNPEYQHDIKFWFITNLDDFENELREWLDPKHPFVTLGIV